MIYHFPAECVCPLEVTTYTGDCSLCVSILPTLYLCMSQCHVDLLTMALLNVQCVLRKEVKLTNFFYIFSKLVTSVYSK